MDYNYDPEYLFSPSQGEAKQERTITEHYFPTNFRFVIYFEKYFVKLILGRKILYVARISRWYFFLQMNLTKHPCAYFLYINNNIGIWYSICFFPVPVILVLKELLVLANLDAS